MLRREEGCRGDGREAALRDPRGGRGERRPRHPRRGRAGGAARQRHGPCAPREPAPRRPIAAPVGVRRAARAGRPGPGARAGGGGRGGTRGCGRAADRHPRRRVARPAHAARVDQGRCVEPAATTTSSGRRRRRRVPRRRSRTRPTGSPASSANLLDMSRLQAGAPETGACTSWASTRWCRRRSRACPTADAGRWSRCPRRSPRRGRRGSVGAGDREHRRPTRRAGRRADCPVRISGSTAGGRVELRVVDRGPGVARRRARADVRPFQRLGDGPAAMAWGSGSRSRKGSSRRWAASSRSKTRPAAGSRWCSPVPAAGRTDDARPGRRRRAPDRPGARRPTCARAGTRSIGPRRGDGARAGGPPASRRRHRWTSGCPASTASR